MPNENQAVEVKPADFFSDHPGSGGKTGGNGTGKKRVPENNIHEMDSPPPGLPKPKLSENAIKVLERRYLKKDINGKIAETPEQMFWRVAMTMAKSEKKFDSQLDEKELASNFYRMMADLDFVPNSPTLMNAGRALGQLSACFVLPVDDSMDAIFEAVKHAALVHKSGGGTGFSFSRLRPKASMVLSTAGTASGPVSFMTVFNAATETIKQGGTRRGANMGILRVDHPDIREFINCKRDNVSITNFNISVAITDKFMNALNNGGKYELVLPHDGKVAGLEDAREIFDMIATNAWHNGDPGVVFIDEINRRNPTPHIGEIESTNPCGEQPLLPYESCNLGSLNLNNMLNEGEIDWEHLRRTVRLSVRFLDDVIEANNYPIEQIRKQTTANRKIGLGIMGFADMLYALRIPYNSEQALELAAKVMGFIQSEARTMSDELAISRGAFPNFEGSVFNRPTRNSTVTTIAPTGTISMIADTSGGVEPNFALCYVKRVMDDDRLLYINKHFEDAAKAGGFYNKELMQKIADGESLDNLKDVPVEIKRVFATAHNISPEWHIRMQAAFQAECDNAVSKTINFPHDATVDDVKNAYLQAWRLKCKGITIYRDGSREVQVLNVGDKKAKTDKENKPDKEQDAAEVKTDIEPGQKISTATFQGHPRPIHKPGTPYIKPRERPAITHGYTQQIPTGDGVLYVTINEDQFGLCEVFTSIGKSGGNASAQSEAIGRLISLALRCGIDPHQIVKQLKGISGSNPIWHEGELVRSTPDAIGRALERYLDSRDNRQMDLPLNNGNPAVDMSEADEKPRIEFAYGVEVKELCPDCQSPVVFEEGCLICRRCGYSKCG